MLKIIFLILMSGGVPVAIAMAGSALIYLFIQDSTPPFVVIHRMVSGHHAEYHHKGGRADLNEQVDQG